MKRKGPRLTTLAMMLAVGLLIAGCATPDESVDREPDAGFGNETGGDGAATNETGAPRPTLPGFDTGRGNATALP